MYFEEKRQRIFTIDYRLSFRGEEAERAVAEAWGGDDPCEEAEGAGGAFVFFMIMIVYKKTFVEKNICW